MEFFLATRLFYLLLLVSLSLFAEETLKMCQDQVEGDTGCCLKLKEDPPFYISDGLWMGDKQYENFRDLYDDSSKPMYIAKDSLVYSPSDLFDTETNHPHRRPFEVLSTPIPLLEDTVKKHKEDARRDHQLKLRKKFPMMFWGAKKLKRAEVGDRGFLDTRGLRKVTEYIYMVSEDAPVFKTPMGDELKGKIILPLMKEDEFMARRCCELVEVPNQGPKNLCYTNYMFKLFDKEGKFLETTDLYYGEGCSPYHFLTAIPFEQSLTFSRIAHLTSEASKYSELFKQAGIENLEMIRRASKWRRRGGKNTTRRANKPYVSLVKLPFDENLKQGPFNMAVYGADDRGRTDTFFHPDSLCGLLQLAKNWSKKCLQPGCQIQIGDGFHPDEWGDHGDHDNGTCVDIRPFRTNDDDITQGTRWHRWKRNSDGQLVRDKKRVNPRYDRDKTLRFINMAIKAGATDIFFNDPKINRYHINMENRKKILKNKIGHKKYDDWWKIRGNPKTDKRNHDDHIHMCFRINNPRVLRTCKEGL